MHSGTFEHCITYVSSRYNYGVRLFMEDAGLDAQHPTLTLRERTEPFEVHILR